MATDMSNTIMRTVSFVERIEIEYHGNIITQAMVLADVDNDMANELVVGNIEGHIAIFKGDSSKPWRKTSVTGMLTCLAVGEILVPGKNSLVCITAEGWCYVYDVPCHNILTSPDDSDESGQIHPLFTQELPANARVMCLADIDSDGQIEMVIGYSDRVVRAFRWHSHPDSSTGHFVPLQKWQLAGQIGSITINHDKQHRPELMVSQPGATFVTLQVRPQTTPPPSRHHSAPDKHTDVPRGTPLSTDVPRGTPLSTDVPRGTPLSTDVPRGTPLSTDMPRGTPLSRSGSFTAQGEALKVTRPPMGGSNSSSRTDVSHKVTRPHTGGSNSSSRTDVSHKPPELNLNNSSLGSTGKLEDVLLRGQGQDTPKGQGPDSQSEPCDLDTKQGGGRSAQGFDPAFEAYGSMLQAPTMCDGEDSFIVYHPLAHSQTRNKDTSTVIIGGINRGRAHGSRVNSTHDTSDPSKGNNSSGDVCKDSNASEATYYALATLDGSLNLVEDDKILWSLHVDHYLFTLAKLDVTGNGKEEVVCCAWSGQTYIVNHSKETVRYDFPESVAAFCAGYYSVRNHINVPCFVYATFNNRICIYPNISLPRVESTNLLKVMSRNPKTSQLLHKLNINQDDTDKVRKLYHWCLYGHHRNT